MPPHFFHVEGLAAALGILGVIWGVLRWLFYGVTAFRAQSRFVRDMGENHLPHIYERLGKIDYQIGLEPTQPPPIKFSE